MIALNKHTVWLLTSDVYVESFIALLLIPSLHVISTTYIVLFLLFCTITASKKTITDAKRTTEWEREGGKENTCAIQYNSLLFLYQDISFFFSSIEEQRIKVEENSLCIFIHTSIVWMICIFTFFFFNKMTIDILIEIIHVKSN